MRQISSVLDQYTEGARFLWQVRKGAVTAPHFSLADLDRLDRRVEAHIDGLRVAGDEGWQLALKEMAWKEPGEVFTAAILAFESNTPSKIAEVLRVATITPELACGVISALGWMDYDGAAPHIRKLCSSELRLHRRIGIAATSIHRKDPGQPLEEAISDPHPLLRARALRATGELGRKELVPLMQKELTAQDDRCRFWAAWSIALVTGYANAVQVLRSFVESPGPYRERALQLAFRRLDIKSAHAWHRQLANNPNSMRIAVVSAGVIGDPTLIPWLIEQMVVLPLARVAGEAFTMITGVDIAYQDLDGEKPEGFEPGPNENPRDDNVEMDPDEKLPWPDAKLIANWWDKHNSEFHNGIRYLVGQPDALEWGHVLRTGRQRQRAAAALELAKGGMLFEVRQPGYRQQKLLKLWAAD